MLMEHLISLLKRTMPIGIGAGITLMAFPLLVSSQDSRSLHASGLIKELAVHEEQLEYLSLMNRDGKIERFAVQCCQSRGFISHLFVHMEQNIPVLITLKSTKEGRVIVDIEDD